MRLLFCAVMALIAGQSARAGTDLAVSANGHYLVRNGKPFLWIGDTAWQLPAKLSRADADFYLDDRRDRGFTVIQIVAYMDSRNSPNANGHRPFHGGETPDPSRPLVVAGGTPDAPNDYWDHFDYVVAAARKRGLHLAILPCWGGSHVGGLNGGGKHVIFDAAKARAYGEFLGERYKAEPHLIWVMGGDVGATTGPKKVESDKRPEYRAMAEGLAFGATGQHPAWNEAHPAWRQVFLTYHPFGGPPAESSSQWFHDDPWCAIHFVQTHRYLNQPYEAMRRDYDLPRPKPTVQSEPAYEGILARDGSAPSPRPDLGPVDALAMRRQVWQSTLAGSCGFTLGLDDDAATRSHGPLWRFVPTWKQLLATPATLSVCDGMRKILLAREWWRWVPDQGVIADGTGEKDLTFAAVRRDDGRELVVYFPVNAAKRIELPALSAGRCRATWVHPQDAATTPAGEFDTAAVKAFTPPAGWPDALLLVEAK